VRHGALAAQAMALSGRLSSLAGGGVCATRRLQAPAAAPTDKRQRFPPAISGHAVWRYCRCALRYRDVAELLAARGVLPTDETVRQWCHTFGPVDAHTSRRRRPEPGDQWHRDAVFSASNGVPHARWRAVDQAGQGRASTACLVFLGGFTVRFSCYVAKDTPEVFRAHCTSHVPARRDQRAATNSRRTLRNGRADVPRVVSTDTLARDGAAPRDVLPSVEHRRHQGLNNRAENAHQPTRERERRMRRFKDPGHAQRFLAAYGPIAGHCRPRRHRLRAPDYRLDPRPTLRHLAGGHRHPGYGLSGERPPPHHAFAHQQTTPLDFN